MPQDASGKLGSIQTINQEIFMSWVYLAIAIAAEIVATTALKASHGFSGLYPSVITVVGYSLAFYCLALTLRVIPVGIAYAIWSSEEHTSALQSLMRTSYAVFCLKKKTTHTKLTEQT